MIPVQHVQQSPHRRSGFTLVELLIVILIISMLLSLVTVAGWRAIVKAKETAIKAEISQIDMAFRAYKSKYGSYPPTVSQAEFNRHARKAFPRYSGTYDVTSLDVAEAVVFYLRGYNANPTTPFNFSSGQQFEEPLFDFDRTRLADADGDGNPEYYPEGLTQPYLYFAADNEDYTGQGSGSGLPYQSSAAGGWMNPDSFQIVSAGADNNFGNTGNKFWPSGAGTNQFDRDNLTNFANKRLEDGE